MREWIGEREVQALAAYDYLIKNKKFEMTIGVPRDDIEDDKYGVYTPLFLKELRTILRPWTRQSM